MLNIWGTYTLSLASDYLFFTYLFAVVATSFARCGVFYTALAGFRAALNITCQHIHAHFLTITVARTKLWTNINCSIENLHLDEKLSL